jgi:hypothetical protein
MEAGSHPTKVLELLNSGLSPTAVLMGKLLWALITAIFLVEIF